MMPRPQSLPLLSTAGYDVYGAPGFLAGYQRMRAQRAGPNEDIEQPAMNCLLPDAAGMDVLDRGCGVGPLARRPAVAGAR